MRERSRMEKWKSGRRHELRLIIHIVIFREFLEALPHLFPRAEETKMWNLLRISYDFLDTFSYRIEKKVRINAVWKNV